MQDCEVVVMMLTSRTDTVRCAAVNRRRRRKGIHLVEVVALLIIHYSYMNPNPRCTHRWGERVDPSLSPVPPEL